MKLLVFILLLTGLNLPGSAQKFLPSKKYEGAYKIVYMSDTAAFENLTAFHRIENTLMYDSSLLVTITDSCLTFDSDLDTFVKYNYFRKKKAIFMYKEIRLHPLLSGAAPPSMQRRYSMRFIPITQNLFALHFKNIKEQGDAGAAEYFGDLHLVVTRVSN